MRSYLESDTAFYVAVGGFITALFVLGLGAFALTNPESLQGTEIVGFVAGFGLFMAVYFVSILVHRLEDGFDVE